METKGPFLFRVEEAQIVEAMQRLMMRRLTTGPQRWLVMAVGVLLFVMFILEVIMTGTISGTVIAFIAAIAAAFVMLRFWIAPMMGRRQFRQSAALRAEHSISWDEEAVHFVSERGNARMPFAEFYGWSETPELVMLYQTEMFFNLVPKAPLGDAAGDLFARLDQAGAKRL